jgi:phosphoribosylformylglycinamidine (FGAM) synthase PurS component
MNSFIIEIEPKKREWDPLADKVQAELLESGETPQTAVVQTRKLYRIKGNFSPEQAEKIASGLLVDPVIEDYSIVDESPTHKKKEKKPKPGFLLDVWPKVGVTDPIGETVEKGLRDLGMPGDLHASFAQRYLFPKITDSKKLKTLAYRVLANELIHDLHIANIQ